MAKEAKVRSVIELPLHTELWQRDLLDKKFECARKIYNNMLAYYYKKYNEMIKTKEWRRICEEIKQEKERIKQMNAEQETEESKTESTKKAKKKKKTKITKTPELTELYNQKNAIMNEFGFTQYTFASQSIKFANYYNKNISSVMARLSIGAPMWSAFEKLFFSDGEKVSYRKPNKEITLTSDNKSGIRFLQEEDGRYYVLMSNMMAKTKPIKMYVKGPKTLYDREMLSATIKQVRILKKNEKGHRKIYCQLVVDRHPFLKLDEEGNLKHKQGEGLVGISIWRNQLCAVSKDRCLVVDMAPNLEKYTKEKQDLDRLIEHLRRTANPENYNEDGTIKKGIIDENGKRVRLTWHYSNHYKKMRSKKRELERYHSVQKEIVQDKAIIELLSMGDQFRIVDSSFVTKKPEFDEENRLTNSEYKKKKERRKSIQESAPSTLITKLNNKLASRNLEPVEKIELPEELYWYQHDAGIADSDLFDGVNIIVANKVVNQNLYRAFLIRYYDSAIKVYQQKAATEEWNHFLSLEHTNI